MSTELPSAEQPSAGALLIGSGAALIVAAGVFIVAVLPAEYGVDPLGTGKLFGFAAISEQDLAAAPVFEVDEVGNALPVKDGPVTHYATPFNVNTVVLTIEPYQFVEYKYHMSKDASLEFTWEASGAVIHDNHGEPDTYPDDPAVSFDKSNVQKASGSFVAPFSGLHGWYWENPGNTPITVTVTGVGFYDYAVELRTNHFRKRHDILSAGEMVADLGRAAPTEVVTP